jgi:hypothetical protein
VDMLYMACLLSASNAVSADSSSDFHTTTTQILFWNGILARRLASAPSGTRESKTYKKEPVKWLGPGKYSARSIKGIWASPPNLHNGSVPTLDDLLKPVNVRPGTFSISSRKYDVNKLGYLQDDKAAVFDTTKLDNSKAGHEGAKYGTTISPAERKDLLEYLKTR